MHAPAHPHTLGGLETKDVDHGRQYSRKLLLEISKIIFSLTIIERKLTEIKWTQDHNSDSVYLLENLVCCHIM